MELTENGRDFHARIALPGFNEKDLKVTAAPGSLIVEAEKTHTHKGNNGGVLLCEFSDKQLFRRLEMPAPINADKVTAKLERGILFIHVPKAVQSKQAKSAGGPVRLSKNEIRTRNTTASSMPIMRLSG